MTAMPLSCVLLADRHHGVAQRVRGLLESAFGTVVMVADEVSLLEGAARLRPDVAIVDLALAPGSNLDWLRRLRRTCPDLGIIVLSVHDEPSVRDAALEAGADAYVVKRAIATELPAAVDRVRGDRHNGAATAAPSPSHLRRDPKDPVRGQH